MLRPEELMLLNCGVGEDSWESLGLQGDPTSPFWRRSTLGVLWREWCWSWNSSTLATSCEELTHWKRLWCWEGLRARGEGDDRGWDGWMASPTGWTSVWVNSGSWWWTGRPGVVRFIGSQRVGHDWATELNWWEKKEQRDYITYSWFIRIIRRSRDGIYFKVCFIWWVLLLGSLLILFAWNTFSIPHIQSIWVPRYEAGLLWTSHIWILLLYPFSQSMSFGWSI